MNQPGIRILPPETAKRIAAGEVIERPASALRELLDNAIDAGATSISVELEGGGIEYLRVVDNGSGMVQKDLQLSIAAHATSKIRELDDLLRLSTLGFRGEALSSMAAVAEVEIISASNDDQAWRLLSSPGREPTMMPWHGSRGTIVTLKELFASFPARRKFLKRASAESTSCRQVFIDKALPFPSIAFRLSSGGKTTLALQPADLAGRVVQAAAPDINPGLFRELSASGEGCRIKLVAGLPAVYRTDRRHLQVFVNGRRVQEYGISQAMEYAYRGALPGGTWPFVYAFVEVDPDLADFNIHPAKKEVRLARLDEIRGAIIRALKDYLGISAQTASNTVATARNRDSQGKELFPTSPRPYDTAPRTDWSGVAEAVAMARSYGGYQTAAALQKQSGAGTSYPDPRYQPDRQDTGQSGAANPSVMEDHRPIRYLGQALGVFLVYEDGDELVMLDQHAAHERILFNQLQAGMVASQELLVPVVYEPESEADDEYLSNNAQALSKAGFRLTRDDGTWLLEASPAILPASRTGELFSLIRSRPDPAELTREAMATVACHAAVRDGEELDSNSAVELIRQAMALPDPHCPHGRPIWFRMSRDQAYRAVRRII
ncbi:MAG: DNA mismatch repair endonuclease MutL [Spirochaetia bacterium]|jgi:DNA mismatch repair protein MutL|nr:DNA mismatch repair endonuclease MutL [Spirochaetia bacterium]